jgi:hypothetical protein
MHGILLDRKHDLQKNHKLSSPLLQPSFSIKKYFPKLKENDFFLNYDFYPIKFKFPSRAKLTVSLTMTMYCVLFFFKTQIISLAFFDIQYLL